MNLAKINLNLLVALDALLTECSVTRAGNKLFITQSATSNILKQLRQLFQDELLVSKGRAMVLTPQAKLLHPQVKQFLTQAEAIFNPKKFDPKTSQRTFTIGMEEYAGVVLLPQLYHYLNKHAPGVILNIKHVPWFHEKVMLKTQEIDLFVGLLSKIDEPEGMEHEVLFREKLVCIGNAKNKNFQGRFTVKKYLAAKHISYYPSEDTTITNLDHVLGTMGYQRNIALRLTRIVPGLYTISKSDIIATVPEGIAKEAKRLFKLSVQKCPIDFPDVTFAQLWHTWTQMDSGCQWLRDVVTRIARSI